MQFTRKSVDLYFAKEHHGPLTDAEIETISNMIDCAGWEAIEAQIQEELDTAFPNRFTIRVTDG